MDSIETFRQSLQHQWDREQFKQRKYAALVLDGIGVAVGIGLFCIPFPPFMIAGGVVAVGIGRFIGYNLECLRQGREIRE